MKNILIPALILTLSSCQKNKTESVGRFEEFEIQSFEKISEEPAMCAKDICVTEKELYDKRGPLIYAIDDKIHHQKYDVAKTILIQKLLEKKLSATGEPFINYHRKTKEKTKIEDTEVDQFLNQLGLTTIRKDSEQFAELKNHLLNEKIQSHYLQVVNEKSQDHDLFVKIPKKVKKPVKVDFNQLITFKTVKNPSLNIAIAFNPSNREHKSLFQIVESLSTYLKKNGEKISWYFIPLSDKNEVQTSYQKVFLCSMRIDEGKTYRSLLDVSMNFEKEPQIMEFLSSKTSRIVELKKCIVEPSIQSKIQELTKVTQELNLFNATQLIINDEVESYIPGLIGFKEMLQKKIKTKTLVRTI